MALTGTTETVWIDTTARQGPSSRFYILGRADVDEDADGLSDGSERWVYKTDAARPDSDGDGLRDGFAVRAHGSDPLRVDTDGNGVPDRMELPSSMLSGDVNGDHRVDAADAAALLSLLETDEVPEGTAMLARADLNGDGVVDELDRQGLEDLLAGKPGLYLFEPVARYVLLRQGDRTAWKPSLHQALR